jgi:hypothetical protein
MRKIWFNWYPPVYASLFFHESYKVGKGALLALIHDHSPRLTAHQSSETQTAGLVQVQKTKNPQSDSTPSISAPTDS